ncbi:MAG TPA: hypothetical protein PLN76_10925 [Saprospiraceae bacterium]|nr:hypothetical protein [Saprospiraceae bacterium]
MMNLKFITLSYLLFLLFTPVKNTGQCTPPSADVCEKAIAFCSLDELNGYSCQNTNYSNPTGCTPLCPSGGGAHNTGWWAFICDGGPVSITMTFSNCSVNGTGVQMGIWGDCNCSESIDCSFNCVGAGSFTLSGNLIACKTYYLFVDGCSGDVCDFKISTSGGAVPEFPSFSDVLGVSDLCEGACDVKYVVLPLGNCEPNYIWTLNGRKVGNSLGNVNLDFPVEGDFQLCVTPFVGNSRSNSICNQYGPICKTIKVRRSPDKIGSPRFICSEEVPYNWFGELVCYTGEYRHEFSDFKTCCNFDSIVHFKVIYDDSLWCKKSTYVTGRVFLDTNVDGIFNSNDKILKNYLLNSDPGSFATFSSDSGYILLVTRDTINTIKVSVPNPNFTFSVPGEHLINVGKEYGQVLGQFDFAIQEKPWIDLEVAISSTFSRPGHSSIVNIQVSNLGNVLVPNSKLSLKFPSGWNIIESTPDYQTVFGGNQLIWDILDTLGIKESKIFTITLGTPSAAKVGSSFSLVADVYCKNDADLLNNQAIWNDEIVTYYDPNDKLVDKTNYNPSTDHSGQLIYTIRFQNTETDTVFDITILDTLAKKLDPTTVRVIHASHPYVMQVKKMGILEILFKNILLPDSSTNEPASHGFVQFSVKPIVGSKPFVLVNRASIYFDNNTPVLTNAAETYIGLVTTKEITRSGKLLVSPNPFHNYLTVDYETDLQSRFYKLQLFNIQGNKLVDINVQKSGQTNINTEFIPRGIYRLFYLADGKVLSSVNVLKIDLR